MAKNHYATLGVNSNASLDQIKSAYRQKAKKLHPDRYGCDSAPFLAVQEAYEVLSDPARRQAYDYQLARERRRQAASGGPRAEPLWSTLCPVEPLIPTERSTCTRGTAYNRSFRDAHSSFGEMLDSLWSELDDLEGDFDSLRSDASGLARPQPQPVEDIHVEIPLSLEQALRGGHVRLWIPIHVRCPSCNGHGSMDLYECWHCYGRGTIAEEQPVSLAFPAGISSGYTVHTPLDRYGIPRVHLTARFRVSRW